MFLDNSGGDDDDDDGDEDNEDDDEDDDDAVNSDNSRTVNTSSRVSASMTNSFTACTRRKLCSFFLCQILPKATGHFISFIFIFYLLLTFNTLNPI